MKRSEGRHSAMDVLDRLAAPEGSPLPEPRLLMVFAHPDDEVLAVGARLARMGRSHLLTITDGAPRDGADAQDHGFRDLEAYRQARQAELAAALEHAGLPANFVLPFTAQVADQDACFHLADLARALAAKLRGWQPEAVLTHPYEGGHPDHDACCFAVHAAVKLLGFEKADESTLPFILEAPFYNVGADGGMRTGVFLPAKLPTKEALCELTAVEQAKKQARLACFRSQAETLAQFGVAEERFRLAPAYNFIEAPHDGELLYEHFQWGMRGERFRELAREASSELFGADFEWAAEEFLKDTTCKG